MASKERLSRSRANGKERGTGWGGPLTQSRPPWAVAGLAEGFLDGSTSLSQKQRSVSASTSMLEPEVNPLPRPHTSGLLRGRRLALRAHDHPGPVLQSRCPC